MERFEFSVIFVKLLCIVFIFIIMMITAMNILGADWSQWFGTNRNGIIQESSDWQIKSPPRKIWTRNVGKRCTSPIIVKGKIYVMGWQGNGDLNSNPIGTDILYCLDAKTGKELWKQTYQCRYQSRNRIGDEGEYGGPSSTPAFDYNTIFCMMGSWFWYFV